jgi:hypothetical protein
MSWLPSEPHFIKFDSNPILTQTFTHRRPPRALTCVGMVPLNDICPPKSIDVSWLSKPKRVGNEPLNELPPPKSTWMMLPAPSHVKRLLNSQPFDCVIELNSQLLPPPMHPMLVKICCTIAQFATGAAWTIASAHSNNSIIPACSSPERNDQLKPLPRMNLIQSV